MSISGSIVNGQFTDCGVGKGFSLNFHCSGPSCVELPSFPGVKCDGDFCTNGINCPQQEPAQTGGGSLINSSFIMQQAPQTLAVNTTQNLFINNHAILMTTNVGGQAIYKDVEKGETVGPNGTASPSSAPPSAAIRLRSRPKILLVMFIVFGLFTNMAWAQSTTADNWNQILEGFPPENIRIVQDHIPQLCTQLVPSLSNVINGKSETYRGVADIARDCLEIISLTNTVVQDPAIALGIAFGNTLICNRIAGAMFGGSAAVVGMKLCNVVAVQVTSSGTTATALAIQQSTSFPSGTVPTSAAFTASGPTNNLPTTFAAPSSTAPATTFVTQTTTGNASALVRRRYEGGLTPLFL